MKRQYYYMISSLPSLLLHKDPPFDIKTFLDMCKAQLKDSDFDILNSSTLFKDDINNENIDILKRWYNWDKGLRNELVRLRAKKLGIKEEEFIRGNEADIYHSKIALGVFQQDLPIKAENILNKERWKYLESLEFNHYFNIEILIVYFLKLQILYRISLFDEKKGRAQLDKLL